MKPTSEKRILIVDDEPKVAIVLAASLRKMGPNFKVETASSAQEALEKINQTQYHLMLTDYKMPAVTGLELAEKVRKRAPETQIVLMTAYGTIELRRKLAELGAHGYIEKPFKVTQLRQVVTETIGRSEPERVPSPPVAEVEPTPAVEIEPPPVPRQNGSGVAALQQVLQKLLRNAHASCIMLLNASGYAIETVGRTEGFDVSSLGALAAANCSVFKSNHHESEKFNLYSYDINGDLFLAVIFGIKTKPGIVWYYTKQVAEELVPLAQHYANFQGPTTSEMTDQINEHFLSELNSAMDSAFLDFDKSVTTVSPPAAEPPVVLPKEQPAQPNTRPQSTNAMTYEEAVKAGLVPQAILKREDNQK